MSEQTTRIASILGNVDIFDNLSDVQYELIAYICREERPQRGDILFREQDKSDDLYIIARGGVEVMMDPATIVAGENKGHTQERVLTELRAGQVFGEVALVDQGIRSASIRISRPDTYLLRIPRAQLVALCDTYPELGYKIMRNLAAELALKLRDTGMTFREYQLSLAKSERDKVADRGDAG